MSDADALARRLRPHYARFLTAVEAAGEVLMTGHSHQAWPDVSRDAQLEAWDDAARLADRKWDRVFGEILPAFRAHLARRIGSRTPDALAIAANTHELGYRVLSAYPRGTPVITTDGEFHSLRRQLARLAEDGTPVLRLPARGAERSLVQRLIAAVEASARPAIVAVSLVLFETSELIGDLTPLLTVARERDCPVIVDAYHAAHALPLDVSSAHGEVFVLGGGYKYAQHGEGACWLHVPASASRLRPVYTGWFADFAGLEHPTDEVGYGTAGDRFLGATFDPTALYRGLRVMEWMEREGLTVAALRAQSLAQTEHLMARAEGRLTVATPRDPERRGAFVAFEHPRAVELTRALATRGVRADARGHHLRFGPAPYTTRAELDRAMDALVDLA